MTDKPKSKHPPLTVSVIRPKIGHRLPPLWERLAADQPDLDPRQTERFLDRLPEDVLDWGEDDVADLMRLWATATKGQGVALSLSAHENGFVALVVAEAHLATVASVTMALAAEGFFLRSIELSGPDKAVGSPLAEGEEYPLSVVECLLAAPLPDGINSLEEARERLLARLQPAFVLLQQGALGRALALAAADSRPALPDVGGAANEVLTPQ
jgi:hypothetical protein